MITLDTLLSELKLEHLSASLDTLSDQAAKQQLSYREFLEQALREEWQGRQQRGLDSRLKQARFPWIKTLEQFDFSFQPSLDRKVIRELAGLRFVERLENLVLLGPPGVGKTHLAIAFGIKAAAAGYRVLFTPLDRLMVSLSKAKQEQHLDRCLQQMANIRVLIIDEIGYLPMNREEASLFFQLLNRRYEKASIILTSNKSFIDWGELFGDPILATAILDRLLHHSTTLNIKGDSYRLREKRKAGLLGQNRIASQQIFAEIASCSINEQSGDRKPDNLRDRNAANLDDR